MRLLPLLALSLSFALSAPPRAAAGAAPDDERARRVLAEMVGAYRSVHTFEQETTYDGAEQAGSNGLVRLHVLMRRPNRLLLQVWRGGTQGSKPKETRFVCDGKSVWTWLEDPGYYIEDKAPRKLSSLSDRFGSIDVAMLLGLDPFADLVKRARSLRLEEPASVDGVDVDVVYLDIGTTDSTGELRLSVGRRDRLLRRFAYETRSLAPPRREGTDAQEAGPPVTRRFGYTNHVVIAPNVAEAAFRWVPPAGAFRYTPYPSLGSLGDLKSIPGVQDPGLPTSQLKLIPLQEYIRRSRKVGKGR